MLPHFYRRFGSIQESFCISELNPMLFRIIFDDFRLRHILVQVLAHKETSHITRIISTSAFPYNMINLSVIGRINSLLIIRGIFLLAAIFYDQSLLYRTRLSLENSIRINDRTAKTGIHILKQLRRIIEISVLRSFCEICRSTVFVFKHFNKFQCRVHIGRKTVSTVLVRNEINIPAMCVYIALEIFTENILWAVLGKEQLGKIFLFIRVLPIQRKFLRFFKFLYSFIS